MPRRKEIQKDLRQGWRNLNRYQKIGIEGKIKYAHRILDMIFSKHNKPIICWSGGKDSTAVLHLCRLYKPDIPVIYSDSGVDFPETRQFIKHLANKWNLNIYIAKPKKGESFWDCVKNYGWPIFSKSISANVEKALRSRNIRDQMSPLEKILAKNDIRISTRCCYFVREKPSKAIEKALNADIKILGLTALESRARVRLWVDHGDYYYVKHYFGKNVGIWKANPISIWTDKDVWKYHKINSIPHCKLYDMGHKRNGCWPCAMGIRNGQLKRLRQSHPKLFKYLITQTEMGAELLKAKFAIKGIDNETLNKLNDYNLILLIKSRPCFFDSM
jgi:3'-phosphoadenosine 5'-phosphosulfate sulfotransferase (PAPS reductase)/FAD synthetase